MNGKRNPYQPTGFEPFHSKNKKLWFSILDWLILVASVSISLISDAAELCLTRFGRIETPDNWLFSLYLAAAIYIVLAGIALASAWSRQNNKRLIFRTAASIWGAFTLIGILGMFRVF